MTLEREIEIESEHGLHLRTAALIAKTACDFDSDIQFCYNNKAANAKSPVSLITLGAARACKVTVQASGDDADGAMEAICSVLSIEHPLEDGRSCC